MPALDKEAFLPSLVWTIICASEARERIHVDKQVDMIFHVKMAIATNKTNFQNHNLLIFEKRMKLVPWQHHSLTAVFSWNKKLAVWVLSMSNMIPAFKNWNEPTNHKRIGTPSGFELQKLYQDVGATSHYTNTADNMKYLIFESRSMIN